MKVYAIVFQDHLLYLLGRLLLSGTLLAFLNVLDNVYQYPDCDVDVDRLVLLKEDSALSHYHLEER